MVTSLLTEGGIQGNRCIGATGLHTRTGKFYIFRGKASIICMSRPARIWLFSAAYPGLCEFRPPQCVGDGHAMGWRAGAEFVMMEKSVKAEFSAAGRSYPPYGAGNNHNTWYPASLIDSDGRKIPYVDRDSNIIENVEGLFKPAAGQEFFMKGGNIEQAKYQYDGPETLPFSKMIEAGYKPPFYADLSGLPELERRVIWGMMIGEEGKTKIPIYKNYSDAGFDPEKDVLQCYGAGWTSSDFLPQERQLFGLPGGFLNDWQLGTNIPGLFIGGDSLYASNCFGHAASTGYYAGRHAAEYAKTAAPNEVDPDQLTKEKQRVYAPLQNDPESSMGWKELNMGISKLMQTYCADTKYDGLLEIALEKLKAYEQLFVTQTYAYNPHELVRLLETFDILTVSQIIVHACLARKTSQKPLCFYRFGCEDDLSDRKLIAIKLNGQDVKQRVVPIDFFGDLRKNYEEFNRDYMTEQMTEARK